MPTAMSKKIEPCSVSLLPGRRRSLPQFACPGLPVLVEQRSALSFPFAYFLLLSTQYLSWRHHLSPHAPFQTQCLNRLLLFCLSQLNEQALSLIFLISDTITRSERDWTIVKGFGSPRTFQASLLLSLSISRKTFSPASGRGAKSTKGWRRCAALICPSSRASYRLAQLRSKNGENDNSGKLLAAASLLTGDRR